MGHHTNPDNLSARDSNGTHRRTAGVTLLVLCERVLGIHVTVATVAILLLIPLPWFVGAWIVSELEKGLKGGEVEREEH